jgi:hypothetical protein
MPFPYEIVHPVEQGPEIRMILDGEEFLLRHDNTIIKHFLVGDGVFDHALHAPDHVSVLPIFFDQPGGKELRRQLISAEYFSVTVKRLDQETIDLIARRFRMPETWLEP